MEGNGPRNPYLGVEEVETETFTSRRVVFALDSEMDYILYILFEVAPEIWLVRIDEEFPFFEDERDICFEKITFTYCNGVRLDFEVGGQAIPFHGAINVNTDQKIDQAAEDGFCFSPDHWPEIATSDQLPEWISNWEINPKKRESSR